MLRICAWCSRPLDGQNDGMDLTLTPGVNDVAHEMGLDPDKKVSHGICNDWASSELESVGIPDEKVLQIISAWKKIG